MKILHIAILGALFIQLTACVQTAPRTEREHGQATRATLRAQIINPEAGNNPDTVTGINGQVARDAIQTYQKSFSDPAPANNDFSIAVGNGNK